MLEGLAVLKFFGDLAAKEGTKSAFKKLTKSSLAERLTEGLIEWSKNLPAEYRDFEPSYLTDVTGGGNSIRRKDQGRANIAVVETLAQLRIPSEELWRAALEERRKDAGELLRANPQSLTAGTRNAFYLVEPEAVADALEDAAEALRTVCLKDPVLTTAATYNKLEEFGEMLRESLSRNQLIPALPPPDDSKPWELAHYVIAGRTEAFAGEAAIATGEWVVATFQLKPSGGWKDPYATIEGLWDEGPNVIRSFSGKPLRLVLANGQKAGSEGTGLCIPSYKVDVEWREQTLVQGPLWGMIKRVVVGRFLQHCKGKQMICRVVYTGRRAERGVVHLFSEAYESYLHSEWGYYKGLETALSTNDLYKRGFSESDLKGLLQEKLMARVTAEAVPDRYRAAFKNRTVDPKDVILVLRGLSERFRMATPAYSSRSARTGSTRVARRAGK